MASLKLMACAAVLVSLAGYSAASVVVFDNTSGQFNWVATQTFWDSGPIAGTPLDITQGPGQTSPGADPFFNSDHRFSAPNVRPGWYDISGSASQVAVTSAVIQGTLDPNSHPVQAFSSGDLVGNGATFDSIGYTAWTGDPSGATAPPTLFLGSHGFVGAQITLTDGAHFGWIELQAVTGQPADGYKPIRWAYETAPGVAIRVPEPASLVVLLAGLTPWLLCGRRRTP